ncbi:MAG TPA: hypothetical protein VIX35_03395, partial [Vicinamibacterales bacterium]
GPALWMVGGCVVAWAAAVGVWGESVGLDVGLGLGGPLVAALGTWAMIAWTVPADDSGRLTRRLLGAFAAKIVFFGVFVAVAIRGFSVRPVAFVVSFTVSFVVLHAVEAMLLRRALTRSLLGH